MGSLNLSTVIGEASNHIDLVMPCCDPYTQEMTETYAIISGMKASKNQVLINKPYNVNDASPSSITLSVMDESGNTYLETLTVTNVAPFTLTKSYGSYFDLPTMSLLTVSSSSCLNNPNDEVLVGQATLKFNKAVTPNCPTNVSVTASRAHTGNQSLKINAGVSISTDQNTLRLEPNKEYVFSAWISEENKVKHTFGNSTIKIHNTTVSPSGEVIEGWQRVEGTFVASANGGVMSLDINAGAENLYIDDIRIFPKQGAIKTYVYDPVNFRLLAALDNNNYATIYAYNPEGQLFLVKKETREGIVTLKEAQSYLLDTKGN